MHVGLDGKAGSRQDAAGGGHVIAVEAEPIGQPKPASDAALAFPLTIMVDEPMAPFAPHRWIVTARDQARILDRDHRLIIEAVERPGLDLALRASTAVQEAVERMQVMVARRADLAQPGLEVRRREQRHSTISRPSAATSKPAASTRRRSGDPSIRIGLVLLMWVKIRRLASPSSRAREPSGPSIGRWPMRRPVFLPTPARIISSSVKSVLSSSTTSARASRPWSASGTAAAPGT